ncbi:hypothetical protein LTSEURB_2333, partial [Salmonella enterica subsp. enterica serovar Urbana str. R8-2977]
MAIPRAVIQPAISAGVAPAASAACLPDNGGGT